MWPLASHERKALLFILGILVVGVVIHFLLRYESFRAFYNHNEFSLENQPLDAFTISLNTAAADELERVKGIGRVLARRIVAYRLRHGAFQTIEDLLKVKGIGPKKLQSFKKFLVVEP